MAKDFKTGEVVQLKSGGPKMTVASDALSDGERVYCQWFSGSKLESGSFPVESIERVVAATPTTAKK